LFDEHKVDEANYRKKLKSYQETYIKFSYDSPFITPKDSFNTLDFNQYEVGSSGKA
jgi:hypothetical protein